MTKAEDFLKTLQGTPPKEVRLKLADSRYSGKEIELARIYLEEIDREQAAQEREHARKLAKFSLIISIVSASILALNAIVGIIAMATQR